MKEAEERDVSFSQRLKGDRSEGCYATTRKGLKWWKIKRA